MTKILLAIFFILSFNCYSQNITIFENGFAKEMQGNTYIFGDNKCVKVSNNTIEPCDSGLQNIELLNNKFYYFAFITKNNIQLYNKSDSLISSIPKGLLNCKHAISFQNLLAITNKKDGVITLEVFDLETNKLVLKLNNREITNMTMNFIVVRNALTSNKEIYTKKGNLIGTFSYRELAYKPLSNYHYILVKSKDGLINTYEIRDLNKQLIIKSTELTSISDTKENIACVEKNKLVILNKEGKNIINQKIREPIRSVRWLNDTLVGTFTETRFVIYNTNSKKSIPYSADMISSLTNRFNLLRISNHDKNEVTVYKITAKGLELPKIYNSFYEIDEDFYCYEKANKIGICNSNLVSIVEFNADDVKEIRSFEKLGHKFFYVIKGTVVHLYNETGILFAKYDQTIIGNKVICGNLATGRKQCEVLLSALTVNSPFNPLKSNNLWEFEKEVMSESFPFTGIMDSNGSILLEAKEHSFIYLLSQGIAYCDKWPNIKLYDFTKHLDTSNLVSINQDDLYKDQPDLMDVLNNFNGYPAESSPRMVTEENRYYEYLNKYCWPTSENCSIYVNRSERMKCDSDILLKFIKSLQSEADNAIFDSIKVKLNITSDAKIASFDILDNQNKHRLKEIQNIITKVNNYKVWKPGELDEIKVGSVYEFYLPLLKR